MPQSSSEEYRAYQAAYRERNREAIRIKEREYYHRNKHWLVPLLKKRRGAKSGTEK